MVWTSTSCLGILQNPEEADLPPIDHAQYIAGWGSGYGLAELSAFLQREASVSPVNVVRYFFWAPPYQGLDVYLDNTSEVHLYTLDPFDPTLGTKVSGIAGDRRTLFVLNPEGEAAQGIATHPWLDEAVLVWQYWRPDGATRLEVWEVAD